MVLRRQSGRCVFVCLVFVENITDLNVTPNTNQLSSRRPTAI